MFQFKVCPHDKSGHSIEVTCDGAPATCEQVESLIDGFNAFAEAMDTTCCDGEEDAPKKKGK